MERSNLNKSCSLEFELFLFLVKSRDIKPWMAASKNSNPVIQKENNKGTK
jgi:hypothetical protein